MNCAPSQPASSAGGGSVGVEACEDGGQNLLELDTLLEDLNRSRFSASAHSNASYGVAAELRPSVDSLLDELSAAVITR